MNSSKSFILCVDDDHINMVLLQYHLKDIYETKCAVNGQECLDAVKERKPDLILLDLMMPVMSGVEACEQLKDSAKTDKIPIIIVTADLKDSTKHDMFKLGVNDYLIKPFTKEQLLNSIINVLP